MADMVWIGTKGQFEVRCASTLKGLSDDMKVSYSTVKNKAGKSEMFTVVADDMSVWFVVHVAVKRVNGRGAGRKFSKTGIINQE